LLFLWAAETHNEATDIKKEAEASFTEWRKPPEAEGEEWRE